MLCERSFLEELRLKLIESVVIRSKWVIEGLCRDVQATTSLRSGVFRIGQSANWVRL